MFESNTKNYAFFKELTHLDELKFSTTNNNIYVLHYII